MGSCELVDMDLESQAILAQVIKQILTIFIKTCDNKIY